MHSSAQPTISSRPDSTRLAPAVASPGRERQQGPYPLASAEHGVTHGPCRRCGAIVAEGRRRSSVASVRRTLAIQVVKSLVVGTGETFQRVLF
jgi:hypothetical protein